MIPTERLDAALIGTGMVASTHVRAFADQSEARLSAVVGTTLEKAQGFCEREAASLGLDPRPMSLGDVCSDPDIDFAVIVTPPSERLHLVETLVSAGKPILMEKPIERDAERAEAIVALAEAAGVPLGLVFQHRMREPARRLAKVVARGDLGTLHVVDVRVPWWRDQSYYDAPGRGTYARDGGGVLITQAIHTLDLLLSLTGPVTSVRALTATTGFHKMEAEDFVVAGLTFENGAVGSLMASTACYPGTSESIALHCERGSAELTPGALTIEWRDGRREEHGEMASSGGGADPMAFTHEWHRDILTDFATSLREGRAPTVTGRAALSVHYLIGAIETAARTSAAHTVGAAE